MIYNTNPFHLSIPLYPKNMDAFPPGCRSGGNLFLPSANLSGIINRKTWFSCYIAGNIGLHWSGMVQYIQLLTNSEIPLEKHGIFRLYRNTLPANTGAQLPVGTAGWRAGTYIVRITGQDGSMLRELVYYKE